MRRRWRSPRPKLNDRLPKAASAQGRDWLPGERATATAGRGPACRGGRQGWRGRALAGLRGAGRRRTRPRAAPRWRRMDSRTNSHRQMSQCKGPESGLQLAKRLRSIHGRPWRRGHLGGHDGLAALERETRVVYEYFDDRTSTRASPAVPLLIQQGHCGQGHRPSPCLARSPRPLFAAPRADRVHAA